MVEFGLKLDDNKVSEWSLYYLDYAKLKAILKKAKALQKKCEEHAEKRPDDAAKIIEAHRMGKTEFITVTPTGSEKSLSKFMEGEGEEEEEASERTSLLTPITVAAPLASIPESPEISSRKVQVMKRSFSNKAISEIQGFFGSRYERTLRGYLTEMDEQAEEFGLLLAEEQNKVTKFYSNKLDELKNRLSMLIDNVRASDNFIRVPQMSQIDEENQKAFISKRTRSEVSPKQRFDSFMGTVRGRLSGVGTARGRMSGVHILEKLRNMSDDGYMPSASARFHHSSADSDDEGEVKAEAEADSIKRALIDQYRTAKLLHNYALLNYTGFVKIVKKFDKSIPGRKGRFNGVLEKKNLFNEGKEVDLLATKYQKYYAYWFCEGDVSAAISQMLPKKGDGLEMDWSQLRLGYRMGMCAVLALWVCWDSVWGLVADGNSTIGGRSAFPVFRACGGILLLQWFWGCSIFIWTRHRINYIYLFDFNPKIVATPLGIFEEAVDNTLVFMLMMLLYYKSGAHDIPRLIPDGGYPFILVLYTVFRLIFPLRSRVPMWMAIWKVVTAPLHSPSFFHGYVGDIFTSMVKVFQDIAWTICWVASGGFMRSEDMKNVTTFHWASAHWYKNVLIPILCLFPLLIRFNQCLRRYIDTGDRKPHLLNAAKYALSQTVTLFGAFHPLYLEYSSNSYLEINLFQAFWMLVFVSSSLYSFTWDVYMDWGLGRPGYNFLGPSLMYPRRYYYYSVMATDLVLRFMWVLTLVPPSSGARFEVPSYLTAVTMMLELFRRTIWGFFRLENEHRSNAAGFRRVGFVPLHFNTGHQHGYKDKEKKSGVSVLREVILIAMAVGGVCVWSVVSAQRANKVTKLMKQEL